MKKWFGFIIALLFINQAAAQKWINPASLEGTVLSKLTVKDIKDSTITLFDTANQQYTLIDLYFNGCKPCNANIPKIKKLQKKFGNILIVISVNTTDKKEAVLKHIETYNTSFIDFAGLGANQIFRHLDTTQYITMGYPTYFLVAPNGTILFGSINSNSWHKKIAKLIK